MKILREKEEISDDVILYSGYAYVILRKLQSDPRFSQYWQMSGGWSLFSQLA